MRPNIGEKHEKLVNKIQKSGTTEYKSATEVVERAIELLWQHEKLLAYKELGAKLAANKNPDDAEFNARLVLAVK